MGVWAGDKTGGCVRTLYDPTFSERGVLMCAGRKLRAKDPLDFQVSCCSCPAVPLLFGVVPATASRVMSQSSRACQGSTMVMTLWHH